MAFWEATIKCEGDKWSDTMLDIPGVCYNVVQSGRCTFFCLERVGWRDWIKLPNLNMCSEHLLSLVSTRIDLKA